MWKLTPDKLCCPFPEHPEDRGGDDCAEVRRGSDAVLLWLVRQQVLHHRLSRQLVPLDRLIAGTDELRDVQLNRS